MNKLFLIFFNFSSIKLFQLLFFNYFTKLFIFKIYNFINNNIEIQNILYS